MIELFSHNVSVSRDPESDLVFLSGLDWEGKPFRLYLHPSEENAVAAELGMEVFEAIAFDLKDE